MISVSRLGRRAVGTMSGVFGLGVIFAGCNALEPEAPGNGYAGESIQLRESALIAVGSLSANSKVRSGSYANTN